MQRPPADYATGNGHQKKCATYAIDKYLRDISADEHVIDIGCGTGETSFYLHQKFRCHLTAVDVGEAMVNHVKERYQSEHFVAELMDIQHRNIQHEAGYRSFFSLATSFFALHWVRDIEAVLDNINWLLKPGGRTLLLIPIFPEPAKHLSAMTMKIMENPRWTEWVNLKALENMRAPWPLASTVDPTHCKSVPWLTQRNALRDMLPRHGFDVLHYEIASDHVPITKAFLKGLHPVMDLVPESMRAILLQDMVASLTQDEKLCNVIDELKHVILVAVKKNANG